MPTLPEILKPKFSKDGISKTYVASQLGVSEKTIENYINGKREPDSIEQLVKLSEVVGFSLNDLSEQSVPKNQKNGSAVKKASKDNISIDSALLHLGDKIDSNLIVLLNELKDIYNQQVETRAEVRGYGQRQIYNEVDWDTQQFLTVMAEVGRLTELNLKSDPRLGKKKNDARK